MWLTHPRVLLEGEKSIPVADIGALIPKDFQVRQYHDPKHFLPRTLFQHVDPSKIRFASAWLNFANASFRTFAMICLFDGFPFLAGALLLSQPRFDCHRHSNEPFISIVIVPCRERAIQALSRRSGYMRAHIVLQRRRQSQRHRSDP